MRFNLPAKKFSVGVFLFLDYMLTTANKHCVPGFDELLFVLPLPINLPGMGDPIKRVYIVRSVKHTNLAILLKFMGKNSLIKL